MPSLVAVRLSCDRVLRLLPSSMLTLLSLLSQPAAAADTIVWSTPAPRSVVTQFAPRFDGQWHLVVQPDDLEILALDADRTGFTTRSLSTVWQGGPRSQQVTHALPADLGAGAPDTIWVEQSDGMYDLITGDVLLDQNPLGRMDIVGDIDGSGTRDLLAVGEGDLWLTSLTGAPVPVAVAPIPLPDLAPGALQVESVVSTDFDGDGYDDVLVNRYDDYAFNNPGTPQSNLALFLGGPTGLTGPAWELDVLPIVVDATLADLDGDGEEELAMVLGTGWNPGFSGLVDVRIGMIDDLAGARTYSEWGPHHVQRLQDIVPTLHRVADLDGDGRDELLLEHEDQSDETTSLWGPDPGTETIDARLLSSTNDYDVANPAATFSVDDPDTPDDRHTLHVVLQDFDGDGLVDLAAQQHPFSGAAVQNQVVQIWFSPLDAHDAMDLPEVPREPGETGHTGDTGTGAGATGDTGGTEPTGDTGGPTSGSTQDTSTTPSSTGDTGGPSTTPADTGGEEESGSACGCQSAPASWWSPWARRSSAR